MSITLLYQYPEVVFASIIGVVMLLLNGRNDAPGYGEGVHAPAFLAEPAKTLLLYLPKNYLLWINRSLMHAGLRTNLSFGDFAAAKIYLPLLALPLAFFFLPYIAVIVALVLFWVPDLYLKVRVYKRQTEIQRALPQAIDLMVLCVDAGLGLDATLQRIASENSELLSALNDELLVLGREILLGADREKAYADLYTRTGVDELKTLGSALNQASVLGLSVSKILRAQSEFLRKRQSQKAEEKAMKMPVYMAFPLWFFIMPALMLLVLGPSLIRFYNTMSMGGG
ncbi:MAG: type II secretion system F family protein [Cyanobacteria bacterium SZAS TMP-1]|nr:type II secretion system F family protein [Cyanobacteria bacterium SZAS TMP-1]